MKRFHVENRNTGSILIEGTLDAAGQPEPVTVAKTLSQDQVAEILEAIRTAATAGYAGGQLPIPGLEWFELDR